MSIGSIRFVLGVGCVLAFAGPGPARAEDPFLTDAVGFAGAIAFLGSGVPGMVIAAVRDGETAFAGFGETAKGSGEEPNADTILRIGSISKAFCGDALASLAADGTLALTDPVSAHLGPDYAVPETDGRPILLLDLATQSSGLAREVPAAPGPADDPFAGNTVAAQQAGLKDASLAFAPGTGAVYSNWGFDLLGASLAEAAGRPYADLLAERVLAPRGMKDTVFNLRPGDEARAMQGHFFDGSPMPLVPSPVTIECAGGLHTTANDMLKWMSWHLDRDSAEDREWRAINHASWLYRDGLTAVGGLDDAGPMAAMALGWVVVMPDGNAPLLLQKTGGLQGTFSYVAISPARGVGVFAAINQFSLGGFETMVKTVNDLIAELAPR